MGRPPTNQPLVPSLLDRLIVEDGGAAQAVAHHRRYTISRFRDSLRRDLEDLLNTHQRAVAAPPDLTDLARSLFDYGIPDLTDVDLSSDLQIDAFRGRLEAAILDFDPRFRRVKVTVEPQNSADHILRFRIDAVVFVYPAEQEVLLRSFMEPTTRQFGFSSLEI